MHNTAQPKTLSPGIDLYNKVRGGFVSKGETLSQWCKDNGHSRQNVKSCLTGAWNGPAAKALRQKLIVAAGLSEKGVKTNA